ncbi:MAG: hypothetical protein ACYDBQ_09875 [Thermoplasmatota archaeon]
MGAALANAAVGAGVLLAGVALILAVVGVLSWRRIGHGRLLWVSLAFVGFVAEGCYLAYASYVDRAAIAASPSLQPLLLPALNVAIVLCLYVAVLRR